jgi:hypothetical protein
MEKTTMELMHDAYLRTLLQGKSPEEKLAIIRNETGLKSGREVLKLRELDPAGYIALRMTKPPEPKYSGNARMQHFSFREVHA